MTDAQSDESAQLPDEDPWTPEDYERWIIQWREMAADLQKSDLHHYTTIGGLKGILDSACLWGTHVAFLNDSQELDYGVGVICDMIKAHRDELSEAAKASPKSDSAEQVSFVSEMVEAVHNFIVMNKEMLKPNLGPFVSCLSTSADQLSQWRGYGQSGGYAIRFDPEALRSSIKHVDADGEECKGPKPALVKVLYNPAPLYEEVTKMVDSHLNEFAKTMKIEDERARDERQITIRYDLLKRLMELAPQIKHHKFGEEQEYRIITHGVEDFYTPAKLGLVPRVLISFDPGAIKEIMVGPGEFADIRKLSIERYLERNARRYGGTPVTLSEVPYREL